MGALKHRLRERAARFVDALVMHPHIVAIVTAYETALARLDDSIDIRAAQRTALIASSAIHVLALATIFLALLTAENGGGSEALSAISVDIVSLQSASDAVAAGREQPSPQPLEAVQQQNVQVSAPAPDLALNSPTLVTITDEGIASAANADAAAMPLDTAAQSRQAGGSGLSGKPIPGSSGTPGSAGAEPGVSAEDALRNQMARCLGASRLGGSPGLAAVSLDVFLSKDGSVAHPPQLTAMTAGLAAIDPQVRMAADAALRAVYVCAPYRMPPSSDAGDITVTFDAQKFAARAAP